MNEIEIAYQETLDYLYSFIDYSLTRNFRYTADKFNLDRVNELLGYLGNPHQQYPIVHLAGTKGKGSTAAMIASVLKASGHRVGFYTSPHLMDYTERIQVDGQPISHAEMVSLVEEMKPAIHKVKEITTFEITTALGFLYFFRKGIDMAVVEVGLGGRLDATNVVNPLVSVITSLSYDHTNVLGDTLSQIATEKAGIIKPGRPVVISPQKEEARKVVVKIAMERDSKLIEVGEDYLFAADTHNLDGQTLLVWSAEEQPLVDEFIQSGGHSFWKPTRLRIPLLGYHQVENAATAYAALQVIKNEGFRITEASVREGFQTVFWPGRFEILRRFPPVILDSAHNPDSALKLRLTLDDYLPDKKVIMVFGASEDKDVRGMFAVLLPRISSLITTSSVHPRAMDAQALAELAHQFGRPAQAVVPVEDALALALKKAGDEMAVLVTGSLFVAAAAREIWHKVYSPLRTFETI